jgi:hypothetical protein
MAAIGFSDATKKKKIPIAMPLDKKNNQKHPV